MKLTSLSSWLSKLRIVMLLAQGRQNVRLDPLHLFIDAGCRFTFGKGSRLSIGRGVQLDRFITVKLSDAATIHLGENVYISEHCRIVAHSSITIGAGCMIADCVSMYDHDHRFGRTDTLISDQGYTCAPIVLGTDVWVGSHVVICKGVTIGDHAVIGAGAVVTRDVPAHSVAAGVPARVLQPRH